MCCMSEQKILARLRELNSIMNINSRVFEPLDFMVEYCLERPLPYLASCSDDDFEHITNELRHRWPEYLNKESKKWPWVL